VETCVVGTGGVGALLEAVDRLGTGLGWAGLGMVPKVEAIGEDGTVLCGDDEDDEDWVGAADILALGGLIFGAGITAGAAGGAGVVVVVEGNLAWTGGALAGMNYAMVSPPVTVYQLNLNSSTLSGSPVKSR